MTDTAPVPSGLVEAEVRRLRASGTFPPTVEAELARSFARLSPPNTLDATYIDAEVPTASRLPGGTTLKRLLRSLLGWYMAVLVQQVNRANAALVGAIQELGTRLDVLEQDAISPRPPGADLLRAVLGVPPPGPVLHAAASERGFLTGLPDASLGCLVLEGGLDRPLAALALDKLAPGGAVLVLGTVSEAWADLLGQAGLAGVEVVPKLPAVMARRPAARPA
jgi:hypothetical protein